MKLNLAALILAFALSAGYTSVLAQGTESPQPEAPERPEAPGRPEETVLMKERIAEFKAAALEFSQQQRDLGKSLGQASREQREQIREQMKASREEFKAAREQFKDDLKELTEKLKEHGRKLGQERDETAEESSRGRE